MQMHCAMNADKCEMLVGTTGTWTSQADTWWEMQLPKYDSALFEDHGRRLVHRVRLIIHDFAHATLDNLDGTSETRASTSRQPWPDLVRRLSGRDEKEED